MADHLLGITVMPEWIQADGAERVVENLLRAGVTAVATSPYVMAPSDAADAGREPPIDAGSGKVRLLDRPLWGKRELRCMTAPSFEPDTSLYRGLAYQPSSPNALTEGEGDQVAGFIAAAKQAGLEVQLQVQAAIPPGYRVQFGGVKAGDKPLLPDGSLHDGRVDKNGSLASPAIIDYARALLRDIAQAYPMVDAVRIDWPEYPPYSLLSWFFDFGDHAVRAGGQKGYDVDAMRKDCLDLMRSPEHFLANGLDQSNGFSALQDLKADLAVDFIAACRDALPADIRLIAHAFPEPWCRLSGMDMARVGQIADEIAVKLYTMHWPMMLASYKHTIQARGTGWTDEAIAARLQQLFDTGDVAADRLRYPEPDEAHPVSGRAQIRKIEAAVATGAAIVPVAHSYGPLENVLERAEIAYSAGDNRVWLNRYGYLSDAKLAGLGRMVSPAG